MSIRPTRTRPKLVPPPPRADSPASDAIQVRGARQNNLKGFDLDLPVNRLIVVTGPSGSGKSSLAFDTLYAEGQRRYVETFSPYTRQFLERMDKPRVDSIHGIPPAIAIEQANHVKSTRSTVGTITEINDYLKVLFPRVARGFCPSCGDLIQPDTARSIAETVAREHAGASVLVTFPVAVPAGEKPAAFFEFLQAQGYLRVWLNGSVVRVDEPLPATLKWLPARVAVLQDRVGVTKENRARLSEAIETALRFGKGRLAIVTTDERRGISVFLGLALSALRSRHRAADARPVQLQSSAGRVSALPRLRPRARHRSGSRAARQEQVDRRRAGEALPKRDVRRMPARPDEERAAGRDRRESARSTICRRRIRTG